MVTSISASVEQTIGIGREIGETARVGDVFALVGDLGSGKTQLVKGIAAAIGAPADVTSPTFTLVHEYSGGSMPIYHFDFYRIRSAAEALQIGLDDYFYGDGVSLVEWADRFPELLPQQTRWLSISTQDDQSRLIEERT